MKQALLSLRAPLVGLAVGGAALWGLHRRLADTSAAGFTFCLGLAFAVLITGTLIERIEAAHERTREGRG